MFRNALSWKRKNKNIHEYFKDSLKIYKNIIIIYIYENVIMKPKILNHCIRVFTIKCCPGESRKPCIFMSPNPKCLPFLLAN
jgi:hypothetical protein